MDLRRLIRFLFAVFVTAGLAVAPLVAPAVANPMVAATDGMSAMPADMPCCPDQQKSNDCQDCPLVAVCMLKVSQAKPAVVVVPVRVPTRTPLAVCDDPIVDGLDRPPPDHPPRSLV